ncbi:STY4526/YPO1902 family pathogenicity island replication protein [Pseudomonas sp. NPDC088368]|uniref:STY4526/YPO1902 family pathogenicity island replication protein n=1 Tax=Pseudomonas sp. NPDC088368 TaxID=3364453 RepID=UPI00382901D9
MAKKQNPLNAAIIDQVLHQLRNGEVRRCFEMGLDPEILNLLQIPGSASVLINASVTWCHVAVDQEMVKRLLSNKERSDEEARIVQRALRLGATTPMLQEFFGMSPQEVSMQRIMAGVPGKPGRNRDLPDDTPLWHRFVKLMEENGANHLDANALLDVAMLLTEEINAPLDADTPAAGDRISLGLVWSKIQQWLNEGLYPAGQARKPASLVLLKNNGRENSGQVNKQKGISLGKVEGERM